MVTSLALEDFLDAPGHIFDVRSPSEFAHARIENARSLPLFSDAERAEVGTAYKQQGRDPAVELGLRLAGPRFGDLVANARHTLGTETAKVYCWRGGMRSGSVAWLLETAGIRTLLLEGGYKTYRGHALKTLDNISSAPGPQIIVLGGMTGSAKTEILHALRELGEQVLDLEGLAQHRGSSYGGLQMPPQPSNEQFENQLAQQWARFNPSKRVWIEDESRSVGRCSIPLTLYSAMEQAKVVAIGKPLEERLDHLMEIYGSSDAEELINATRRIEKRLGSERTRHSIEALESGHYREAFTDILYYYDKSYQHALSRRTKTPHFIEEVGRSPCEWAELLLNYVR